jgi:uncharacterized membrane protein YphA (DoxX/SURF4 family)
MHSAGLAGVAAAILLVCRFVIAGIFIRAGLIKLANLSEFRLAVMNYQIVPVRLVSGTAIAVAAVEAGAGLLLLLGVVPMIVAAALAALLLCFSAAITVNLARGRVFDCGCDSSGIAPQTISWAHVGTNVVLAGVAVVISIAPPAGLALLPGPAGVLSIGIPAGSDVPILLTAALAILLTRVLGAAVAARRLIRDSVS